MEVTSLPDLDDELNKLWRLGRSAVIGWCHSPSGIEVLAVPQFLLSNLLTNREDFLADESEVSRETLYMISDLCEIEPYRIYCPTLLSQKDEILKVIQRYSVSLKKDKAVILLDTVSFSKYSPLDQVTLLNSLSYSINIANKRARAAGLPLALEHSTTGDGFYVWNRADGFDANVDLFSVMTLILADNAIAREKSMPGKVPVLRACFHIGNCYEYFLARGDRPGESSYIVGDATIDAARMIGKALPGQLLVGNFVCPVNGKTSNRRGSAVNTPEFIEIVADRLRRFEDVVLSRDTIKSLVCHLTGEPTGTGGYNLIRYVISDKHGFKHEVFNAKINIHRSRSPSVYLGLRSQELEDFSVVAKTTSHFTPYGDSPGGNGEDGDGGEMETKTPPKVLVVDDEPLIRELLTQWLHEAGFVSVQAENAAAARDQIEDNRDISAIVTDVMLPGDMSGIDLASYALSLGRQIRIIFVSGYSAATMLDEDSDLIRNAPFLMKPLEMDDFFKIVSDQFPEHRVDL